MEALDVIERICPGIIGALELLGASNVLRETPGLPHETEPGPAMHAHRSGDLRTQRLKKMSNGLGDQFAGNTL